MKEPTLEELTLNNKITKIRKTLAESNLKKSGINKHTNTKYFELGDFLPTINKLYEEYDVNDVFNIKENQAVLEVTSGIETNTYSIPFNKDFTIPKGFQEIQYLGALISYLKRYLYMNAFGISEGDIIEAMSPEEVEEARNIDEKVKIFKEKLSKLPKEDNKKFKSTVEIKANPTLKEITKLVEKLDKYIEKHVNEDELVVNDPNIDIIDIIDKF